METIMTITIQAIIQHETDEEYEEKSNELIEELEKRFEFVDVTSEYCEDEDI